MTNRIKIPRRPEPKGGSVFLDVRGDKSFISKKGLRVLTGRKLKGKNETIVFSTDGVWIVPKSCEIFNLRAIRQQIEQQTGMKLEELVLLSPDEYRAIRDGKPVKIEPKLSAPEYQAEFENVNTDEILAEFYGE